jgi:hypothetical protein
MAPKSSIGWRPALRPDGHSPAPSVTHGEGLGDIRPASGPGPGPAQVVDTAAIWPRGHPVSIDIRDGGSVYANGYRIRRVSDVGARSGPFDDGPAAALPECIDLSVPTGKFLAMLSPMALTSVVHGVTGSQNSPPPGAKNSANEAAVVLSPFHPDYRTSSRTGRCRRCWPWSQPRCLERDLVVVRDRRSRTTLHSVE